MATLWIKNDNLVRLLDLVDQSGGNEATPSDVTSATVTAQIKNSTGENVGSAITLSYVTDTNSDYEGVAPDTLSLTHGEEYTVEVTADDGPDRRGFWVLRALALTRMVS
jgi:hypothetical protein